MSESPIQAMVVAKSRELSAIAAAETSKAMIQAAYTMAAAKPRDKMQIREKLIEICKDPEFAEVAFYKPRPVGWDPKTKQQKTVQDFSIRFAEEVHTQWTNLMVKTTVLYDDDEIRKIEVSVIDLERNAFSAEEFVIPKIVERKSKKFRDDDVLYERKNSSEETVYGLRATEQEVDQMVGARRSKVKRSLLLALFPADLKNELRRLVYATRDKEISDDPIAYRKRWVDAFGKIGVQVKDLEAYLNKKIDDANSEDWGELAGIHTAIKEGGAKWSDYASRPQPATSILDVDALKPGNPDDHTDVKEPVGKAATTSKIGACEKYLIQLFENWELTANGVSAANRFMADNGIEFEKMPDKGLAALKTFVADKLLPFLKEKEWVTPETTV